MKKIILLLFFTIFLISNYSKAGLISGCMDINTSGVYYLNGNIYKPDAGACIRVFASNVVILCNGYEIYGARDPLQGTGPISYGIVIIEASNVEIHDCIIHNFDGGIIIDASSNVMIFESEIYNNNVGIGTSRANGNVMLYGNVIRNNVDSGAILYSVNRAYVVPIDTPQGPKRNWFYNNLGWSIKLINSVFQIQGNLFFDRYPIRFENSNGLVVDNGFTGNFVAMNYISGNVQFYITPVRNLECEYNYLLGCGRGGNYYSTYSINCRNDNKDSFCDSGYNIPNVPSGPTLIDQYPLAYPQPYLKRPTLPSSVSVLPGGSVDITIGISWNYLINPVSIQCNPDSPLICQFVSHNCNYNQQDGSCQYVYRIIAPSNTPLGGYDVDFILTSGDCRYERTVDVNVYSQACSGRVSMSISPSRVRKGETATATISGLTNCGGTAYIRYPNCNGFTIAQCSVSGSGCSAIIDTSTMSTGNWLLYGCFDINGNGVYESGEFDSKNLEIYEEVGPSLGNNITGCGEIRNPGYYYLSSDIYSNMSTAIKILASNVILDCDGRMISAGTENNIGISVLGASNVKIMNCVLSGFNNSIYISNSNDVQILYSKILSSNVGIRADNSVGPTSNINIYSTDFSNNNYGVVATNVNGVYLSCERGRLFERPEVMNSFLGSINNSIVFNNVNLFIITCSEFTDRIPLKISNSNGYVFDNKFYGDFERVDVSGNVKFSYIYRVKNIAGTNVLLGCGGGGNYYSTNDNCRNRDLDSFCDSKYRVPGTNIYDELPLANPQPYLVVGDRFYGLQIENITVEEGSSVGITIPLSWNYKIGKIEGTCSIQQPLECKVNLKGCDTSVENGGCYAEVLINVPPPPPNVNYTGMYSLNISFTSGDCVYRTFTNVLVYKIIYPPLYPEIPFLSIPLVAIALIFGFGTAMEIGISKRGGKSNGAVLLSFVIVGIIAMVLMKLISGFVLYILVIIGALMFAVILSKILGGW